MSRTSGPATRAFLAGLSDEERAQRDVVLSLSDEERGALPARLRRLVADERALAWGAAKARRDAALDAAAAERDQAIAAAGDDTDAAEAAGVAYAELVAAARDEWAAAKAELGAGDEEG